jgi:hypothetical protein
LAFGLIGGVALTLACATSLAADPSAAEALFEEGVSLSQHGALPQACAKFEASEALDVAVGTLLRLADCYERTRRLASAWSRFREAASLAQVQSMPDRQRIASVRAAALQSRMARLTISVPPNPPEGYSLELSGTAIPPASWGTPLPVDAGTSTLEASAPGYLSFKRAVVIPSLDGARVVVSMQPLEPEPVVVSSRELSQHAVPRQPPAGPEPTTAGPSGQRRDREDRGYAARVLGATSAVAGAAGLASGGVLAVLAGRRTDHSLDYCDDNGRHCTARGLELRHEADTLSKAATISAAAGGALLVTGFVVYTTAPHGQAAEPVSVSAVPQAFPRGVTLQVRGAF